MSDDLMARLQTSLQGSLHTDPVEGIARGAAISTCGLYRYQLWRYWGSGDAMVWIMLNPSTADRDVDDPTIRRCMAFAKREGFDGIEVLNLYGLRATKPAHLLDHPDPEGPDNYKHWTRVLGYPWIKMVVAAWGASAPKGCPPSRALKGRYMEGWLTLGVTAEGHPRHPLYVKSDTPLERYRPSVVTVA